MDLCDPWSGPSDNEDQDVQHNGQPGSDHDDVSTEDAWSDPEEQWPDPWQFLGPPQEVPIPPMQPLQDPEEEILAMGWGDLHSANNDWPVAIAPERERNQMEVEDANAMTQRAIDQEEEQATWYGTIAAIASTLECDCKTEPPSSEPSEVDAALQQDQDQDQEEYEEVHEEPFYHDNTKVEPREYRGTKGQVPEPAVPPRHAAQQVTPPWRTTAWHNYWSQNPASGASSSRPGPYTAVPSRPAAAPSHGPQPASYMTGWKAKVCYFLSAWNHHDLTKCDQLLAEYLSSPPQAHQLTQPGDKGGANWATKAKWLYEAYQSHNNAKVTNLVNWHFDQISVFYNVFLSLCFFNQVVAAINSIICWKAMWQYMYISKPTLLTKVCQAAPHGHAAERLRR